MGDMTVRHIPEDQHAALRRIARTNNRSTEAEAHLAIALYIESQSMAGFGSRLVEKYGGILDQDFAKARDGTGSGPVSFE